jgi:hypothetical protein
VEGLQDASLVLLTCRDDVEPMTGIEPAYSAWEADVLPLNYIGAVALTCGDVVGGVSLAGR